MAAFPETTERHCLCCGHGVRQGEACIHSLLGAKREGDNVDDFILDRPRKVYTGDKRPTLSSRVGKLVKKALGKVAPADAERARLTNHVVPKALNISKERDVIPKSSRSSGPSSMTELAAEFDMIAADICPEWPISRNSQELRR